MPETSTPLLTGPPPGGGSQPAREVPSMRREGDEALRTGSLEGFKVKAVNRRQQWRGWRLLTHRQAAPGGGWARGPVQLLECSSAP